MNIPIIIANILTLLAFVIHTFLGDRELKIIEPENENDEKYLNSGRECRWKWFAGISFS
jgi:hypothetical protein